jgi:hypothetical protein
MSDKSQVKLLMGSCRAEQYCTRQTPVISSNITVSDTALLRYRWQQTITNFMHPEHV